MSNEQPRAMVLVDVQNAYYTTRDAFAKHLNYNQLWADISHRYQIHVALAYAIERQDPKQQSFQNILRAIGFEVKLKPFIQRQDGSAKGDWDVGITVDAMLYAEQVDVVILVTGDGDFDILAQTLRMHYHKRVEVYGVERLTAASLIKAADQFIEINQPLLMP
ncbi:NYN domain-containing protein [Marinomonas ostreistagni]|uniref:NYN domain-containing protein n=1 Tax=Marinomonas ostreistagni TaxID=359209 RepID=UPI00194E799C|nr:NYN domain-containing protein [Marinomonas ostreistagni]MBM6551889.1 NYN domain-containing protein [Marinomonas ostreistagni]